MEKYGIYVPVKHFPELDEDFIPIHGFNREFLKDAKKPFYLALEGAGGRVAVKHTFIHETEDKKEADLYYVERLIKTLLWTIGGFRVYVWGDKRVYEYLSRTYSHDGLRKFDFDFMADVYEHPFEIFYTDALPSWKDYPRKVGGGLNGCRIGLDLGGSDIKVSAMFDGKTVYADEIVWSPKTKTDPDYHYETIVSTLKKAAAHLPGVDAVGVSSAGIHIDNLTKVASLFIKVPPELFKDKVRDIYIRAITDTFGPVPMEVANDGDVSALAGSMSLNDNSVLGIAMGTSEAGGFVDDQGNITGWLNELAFVPVDVAANAAKDEWSGDIGCGVKYFSQDSCIRLAESTGISFDKDLAPGGKLEIIQELMKTGDERILRVYRTMGTYLGHTLPFYYSLYECRNVLLLGRVMSGQGGDIILNTAREVLKDEYPLEAQQIKIVLPDERFRRIGQSLAAASLPKIK